MSDENALAKTNNTQALASVDFGEYAGMGLENQTSRDVAIPFLGLVQALSPELQEGAAKFIPGAKDGSLFNTVTRELLGSTVYVVPCYTENVYVEWVPRDAGGGFVAVHALDSEVVAKARASAKSFKDQKTEAGNELQETFYMYGLLLDGKEGKTGVSPIVIAFTGSKIKVYKQLMTQIRTMKGRFPLFAFRLGVSSVTAKNKKNQPYKNFKLEAANGSLADSINMPGSDYAGLLVEGKALVEAIKSGLARAAVETQSTREPGADEEAEMF